MLDNYTNRINFLSKLDKMGFLGEIRKLLFGVTSVSKSGADKVVTKGKEIGEDIVDKGSVVFEKGKDMAEDAYEKGKDMAGDAFVKGKDMAGDAFEKGKDIAGDVMEKAGDTLGSLKNKAKDMISDISDSPAVEKAGNFTEGVGEKVIKVGGELTEKAADLSETVGEKVLDVKDKLVDKAKELSGKANDKFEETYQKAKALEAEEALEPKGEFADTILDAGDSLLEDTDDFFSKAEKYADGNYSGKDKTAPVVEDPNTIQIGETTISLPEPDAKPKEMAKAAGFDDLDGDGNEVVDDAIIVEDSVITEATDVVEEVQALGAGMANQAQDAVQSEVNEKVEEMKDMMDKVLGDGEEE